MPQGSILVVDDSPAVRENLSELLTAEGYEVDSCAGGKEALQFLQERTYDVVLTDLSMPDVDGMAVLSYLAEHFPETSCIIITGFGTIQTAVDAMRVGAYDYLCKPVESQQILHGCGQVAGTSAPAAGKFAPEKATARKIRF